MRRVLYSRRYARCAASLGYESPGAYGYVLIAWNGSGATVLPNAVFKSASLIQPSEYSRNVRFHPGGNGGADAASNSTVVSSPGAMTANMSSPRFSSAPVYRVLTQFEQAGLLMRHHFESGKAVFELNEGSHHDHIVCVSCGHVEEFNAPEIEKRQEKVARQLGFVIRDHHMILYAESCPHCPRPS